MKFFNKMRTAALLASSSCLASGLTVASAAAVPASEIVESVLGVVFTIAMYIGIILLVWSIIMLVMAMKNEDADSKSRAIMLIAVSIALISMKFLIQPLLTSLMASI